MSIRHCRSPGEVTWRDDTLHTASLMPLGILLPFPPEETAAPERGMEGETKKTYSDRGPRQAEAALGRAR